MWKTKKIKNIDREIKLLALAVFILFLITIIAFINGMITWSAEFDRAKAIQEFNKYKAIEGDLKEKREVKIAAIKVVPQYDDKTIIEAIITESIGEPTNGIIAVAFVFRNRLRADMGLGACGLNRDNKLLFISVQPRWKKNLIKEIWADVKSGKISDTTKGALYFENVNAFGRPSWINDVEFIMEIGNHRFYK